MDELESVADDDEDEDEDEESDLDLLLDETLQSVVLNHPALATPHAIDTLSTPWPYTHVDQAAPVHVAPAATVVARFAPVLIPASSLPHEILLHILKLLAPTSLSPALLVCKAWCQCGVELLWHKPALSSLGALLRMLIIVGSSSNGTAPALAPPTDSYHHITALDTGATVPAAAAVTVSTRSSAKSLLPNGTTFPYPDFIRRLNFSSLAQSITDPILLRLLPCTHLERLTLASCTSLTTPTLITLLSHCSRLVALDVSDVVGVEDAVLQQVGQTCRGLQGLNLSGCTRVTNLGVEAIAAGCSKLRRVSRGWSFLPQVWARLTDRVIFLSRSSSDRFI